MFTLAAAPALETAPAVMDIGLILLLAVLAGWLARRIGLPAVLGYLAVGFVVSPPLARLHSEHDLFLLLSVGSGLAIAGVGASFFGVPLALAAFIAGLTIGESPVASEARRRIVPFRDLFAVLFFVSLGTLLDPQAVPGALPWVAFVLIAVVAAKQLPVYVLSRAARLRDVNRLQLATGLGQVGEFSFVLATIVVARNLIPNELFTAIIVSVVLTIAVSTIAVRLIGRTREAAKPIAG